MIQKIQSYIISPVWNKRKIPVEINHLIPPTSYNYLFLYLHSLGQVGGFVPSPTLSSSSFMMKPEDTSSDETQAVSPLLTLFAVMCFCMWYWMQKVVCFCPTEKQVCASHWQHQNDRLSHRCVCVRHKLLCPPSSVFLIPTTTEPLRTPVRSHMAGAQWDFNLQPCHC